MSTGGAVRGGWVESKQFPAKSRHEYAKYVLNRNITAHLIGRVFYVVRFCTSLKIAGGYQALGTYVPASMCSCVLVHDVGVNRVLLYLVVGNVS